MTALLSLETILSEFGDDYEAWVLQDRTSGNYVIVPDDRFPGRRPIRFFMRREDAEALLHALIDVNVRLRDKEIYPVKVPLKRAVRGIAADRTPGNADACVVHSPNEVLEWVRDCD